MTAINRPPGYRPAPIGPLVLGGDRPVICVPIVAETAEAAVSQAAELARLAPDLLEWRVDYLGVVDTVAAVETLRAIRDAAGLPILVTVRDPAEGGHWRGGAETRLALLAELAASGLADALDVEAGAGAAAVETIRRQLPVGRALIVSWHDFAGMPAAADLVGRAHAMAALGADAVKLVAMAHTPADGLTVLQAAEQLARELTVPCLLIAMGPAGAYTRAVAPLLGSALTFAAGANASAPGQFAPATLREMLRVFGAEVRD